MGVTDGLTCGNLNAELFPENNLDLEKDRLGLFVYNTLLVLTPRPWFEVGQEILTRQKRRHLVYFYVQ